MKVRQLRSREEFDSATSGDIAMVLVYSDWCPFCRSFLPAFEAAAGENAFLKASTDDLPELEKMFAVDVVPTILCFGAGRLKSRLDGQLGRGITAAALKDFAASCGLP